jgi:hypothetical protein
MLDDTVFAKARAEDIRDAPFPHLVLEDALDPSVYDRLARTRPSYPGDPSVGNRRLAIPAWMLMALDLYDPVWRALARTHTDRRITDRVAELFADRWPAHLRGVVRRGTRFGVMGRDGYDRADVLTDARLEVISPVRGEPGTHRGGHVDTPNRLFSALFYLRAPDDDSTGGGLELFRYRGVPPDPVDAYELPPDSIERAATVPYRANTLVVFPNGPFSVHGAEPRGVTPHDRAYVFITAEVENDLF